MPHGYEQKILFVAMPHGYEQNQKVGFDSERYYGIYFALCEKLFLAVLNIWQIWTKFYLKLSMFVGCLQTTILSHFRHIFPPFFWGGGLASEARRDIVVIFTIVSLKYSFNG